MFSLDFHYEDVSRQDLLLKLNHANVMEVPGSCEIRVVPKAPYNFIIKNGKLAMEIARGQKFIQTQRGSTGKSFRSNPFLESNKDKRYVSDLARQSTLRGHGMSNFLVIISTVMSLLDSQGRNTGKLHSILDGNGVLRILLGTGSFRDLRTYSRVQCDYCHFGQHTR